MSDQVQGVSAYKRNVRQVHAAAFALHHEVATTLEQSVIAPRMVETETQHALDIMLLQAYKAHLSLVVLCELGHYEDSATIARRLLELAARSGWIATAATEEEAIARAGGFLAALWDGFPSENRELLPATVRERWESFHEKYAGCLEGNARRWCPSFEAIFADLGLSATYEEDYRFLSSIAHGSPSEAVVPHSLARVPVRSHNQVSAVLVFGSRYYVAVAKAWGGAFPGMLPEELDTLEERLANWQGPTEAV